MKNASSSDSYLVRPFQAGDEWPINAEFNRIFGKQRTMAEWNWKYGKNSEQSLIYILSDADDNILAHYGGRRMRLWANNQEIAAGHITDSFAKRIGPVVRGQWFNKLRSAFFDEFGNDQCWPVIYGFPGERAKRQALHAHSHEEHYPITRWHLDTNLLDHHVKKQWKTSHGHLLQSQADQLWMRSKARYEFCVVRDGRWLDWRFHQHPNSEKYHLFWVKKSGLWPSSVKAWAVFCENDGDWLCVDLLWDGHHEDALDALFGAAASKLRPTSGLFQLWADADADLAAYLNGRSSSKMIWEDGPQYSCRCFSPNLKSVLNPAAFYRTAADLDIV